MSLDQVASEGSDAVEGRLNESESTGIRRLLTWVRRSATPRKIVSGLVALIALVASIFSLLGVSLLHFISHPRPVSTMTGDFNIAVASFSQVDAGGRAVKSNEGQALAASVSRAIVDDLGPLKQAGFDIQVRSSSETGEIPGATVASRAPVAGRLADRIHADVVMYGTLSSDSATTVFVPEFYLNGRKLVDAEELTGQHQLGSLQSAGDIAANPASRADLRGQILARARSWADFIFGLGYYSARHLEDALRQFQAAVQTGGWEDHNGREVLYLFLGNTAGKLHQLSQAGLYYSQALESNPQYSRAWLGTGEIRFLTAEGTCEAGHVDVAGMAKAAEAYMSALAARFQPQLAEVRAKAAFGLGRIDLCLSQALVADRWADAERQFQQVIHDFDAGNDRLLNLAAESHGDLALVYLPPVGDPQGKAKYERALSEYGEAIRLTPQTDRRALFYSMQGFVYARLAKYSEATQAYDLAIQLAPDATTRAKYQDELQKVMANSGQQPGGGP